VPLNLLIATALAGQVPAAPLSAPDALTREEARTEPVDVLARRLLGATGALVREVERPPPEPYPGQTHLQNLTFASAPRWSRVAGLCEADRYVLGFEPAGGASEGTEPPVRVSRLAVLQTFRAIGDPRPARAHWTEEEQERYEPACAESGPVLGTRSHYFSGYTSVGRFNARHAAFAVRAYRAAIASARNGTLTAIQCQDDRSTGVPRICGDPAATLAVLAPEAPDWFEIEQCREAPETLCVTATVPRNIDGLGAQRQIVLRIGTAHPDAVPSAPNIELRSVSLSARTIVF
jgi:hypothetical protein